MLRNTFSKSIVNVVILFAILLPVRVFAEGNQVLRLLVWEGYAPQAQREQFIHYIKDKYAVRLILEVDYIAESEDCFEALRLKKADIVSPAHNRINDKRFRMIDSGLLLPLNLANLPNYKELNPSFKYLEHLIKDGVHYGLPFAWGPYGIVYNTALFDEAPDNLNVLWDPKYQGQYSIADYGEINIYLTALTMGYDAPALADFEKLNNPAFKEKLAALVNNAESLWVGVDTANDLQQKTLASSWGFA